MQRLAYGGELLMVVLRVDTDSFVDASAQAHSIAQSVSRALSRAVSGFGGLSQMAGSDPNGLKWAASYDQACGQLLSFAAQLQDAVSSVSRKLAVTGYYYEVVELANAGEANFGLALPAPVVATSCPAIPSAAGGHRKFPSPVPGMEWVAEQIANLVGNMWPDGDTAKLDEASRVWHRLADDLDDVATAVSTVPHALAGVNTPELSRIEDEVDRVRTFATKVASACRELGASCNALSGKIAHVHLQTGITVGVTIAAIGVTVAAALGLTVFTFGISDAVGVAGVAGETAGAVATIMDFIAELGASISAAVGGIAASTAGLVGISADLVATIGVTVGDITASAVLWGLAGAGENMLVTGITEPDTGDLLGAAEEGFIGGAAGGALAEPLGRRSKASAQRGLMSAIVSPSPRRISKQYRITPVSDPRLSIVRIVDLPNSPRNWRGGRRQYRPRFPNCPIVQARFSGARISLPSRFLATCPEHFAARPPSRVRRPINIELSAGTPCF